MTLTRPEPGRELPRAGADRRSGPPIQMLSRAPSGRPWTSRRRSWYATTAVNTIALVITVRGGAGARRSVGSEADPTCGRRRPTPEPDAPARGFAAAYARNAAVMTVGTTLSRFTGFLRIAAQTAALGVTVSALADTYNKANTTPNIIYELALGGILTSVFVPLFVEWMQHARAGRLMGGRRPGAHAGAGGPVGVIAARRDLRAVDHPGVQLASHDGARPARPSSSWAPSSCGGSCRRSCSTGSGRSRAGC